METTVKALLDNAILQSVAESYIDLWNDWEVNKMALNNTNTTFLKGSYENDLVFLLKTAENNAANLRLFQSGFHNILGGRPGQMRTRYSYITFRLYTA